MTLFYGIIFYLIGVTVAGAMARILYYKLHPLRAFFPLRMVFMYTFLILFIASLSWLSVALMGWFIFSDWLIAYYRNRH